MEDRLSGNFITELIAYALSSKTLFEIVNANLKFAYLQDEPQKRLWKFLTNEYRKRGLLPTHGQIQQQFINDDRTLEFIADVYDVEVTDTPEGQQSIIGTFEAYLKQMMFLDSNERIVNAYNSGDKQRAYDLFVSSVDKFSRFSITSDASSRVFGDFKQRQAQRLSADYNSTFVIPTCIDELDWRIGCERGGAESGECWLWLGDSGMGKSQLLIHLGISASRLHHRVVHFQLEGTRKQCLDRYDAAWTGSLYSDMKFGQVEKKRMDIAQRVMKRLSNTDIHVFSVEEWGGMTVAELRKHCKDVELKYGKIDMIIVDYLELLELGDGIKYTPNEERFRQEKLARAMKTLAMEFNAVVHTATQSNGVPREMRNDPDFVYSRDNLNEAKGKIRPFDAMVTLNQTSDERVNHIMRLYVDKLREHAADYKVYIVNNFARSRFYDRKATMEIDWETYEAKESEK